MKINRGAWRSVTAAGLFAMSMVWAGATDIASVVEVQPENASGAGGQIHLQGSGGYSGAKVDVSYGRFHAFSDSGTSLMRLDLTSGFLGLGPGNDAVTSLDVQTGARGLNGVYIHSNSARELHLSPDLSAGAWNPLVHDGDSGMIFDGGQMNTGGLVIGPWGAAPTGIRLDANGNVGINTADPAYPLDVTGTARAGSIIATSYLGVGPDNLQSSVFDVSTTSDRLDGFLLHSGSTRWLRFVPYAPGGAWNPMTTDGDTVMIFGAETSSSGSNGFSIVPWSDVSAGLRIDHNGNVGIGTASATHKLEVNGTIHAKEVIVEAANWPDDVFAPGYALRSLDELSSSIRREGHLPGLPSKAEAETHGVSMGAVQKAVLKQVEELSLHMIRLNDENKQLKAENQRLAGEMTEIKAMLKQLVSRKQKE